MKGYLVQVFFKILEFIVLPFFLGAYAIIVIIKYIKKSRNTPSLVWGTDPIINNRYCNDAMKAIGYNTKTFMNGFYSSINKKEDYDLYLEDLLPFKLPIAFRAYYGFLYAICHFDIIHHPAHGFLLRFTTLLKYKEGMLLKFAGCKSVVLPYGSDIWLYSQIKSVELRHAFLTSYPNAGKEEPQLKRQLNYWINNSDFFFPGHQTDGIGYWDALVYNYIVIDESKWSVKPNDNINRDGIENAVRIIHSPNHRGVKGTEFIIQAVEQLKKEGLLVELILLEKILNEEVKEHMDRADILIEQLMFGHGLSAVEGMAKGLVVISNLEDEIRNKGFRTYSYFDECPIVSASREDITEVLRTLVTNPSLRDQLSKAGREYVLKYHSFAYGQFLFQKIYDKIWNGKEVDFMNMFHPLKPESYNNQSPLIKHPLKKNKLPVF